MSNWAPKPLMKADENGLFPVSDSVSVVKGGVSPLAQQRRNDGTPPTVPGRMAFRPEGPSLKLDGLEKSYSASEPEKKEVYDPDAVIKAYLSQND